MAKAIPPAKLVGVWIDHKQAKVVELVGEEVRQYEVASELEHRARKTGGTRLPGKAFSKNFVASEKNLDAARREHLNKYYRAVTQALKDADRLIVMGPGEAKSELLKALKRSRRLAAAVEEVQTAAKLTDRQFVARVKSYFH